MRECVCVSERAVSVTRLSQCFVDHWAVCERQRATVCVCVCGSEKRSRGGGCLPHTSHHQKACVFLSSVFPKQRLFKMYENGGKILHPLL